MARPAPVADAVERARASRPCLASSNPELLACARTGGEDKPKGPPMRRLARRADLGRPTGTALAAVVRASVVGPVTRRKKTLVLAGTAVALAGIGTASAAMTTGSAPATAGAPTARLARLPGTARPRLTAGHVLVAADLLRPAAPRRAPVPASKPAIQPASISSWQQVSAAFSGQGAPAAAAQLTPAGTSGPQGWMPISGPQYANATTIVRQVLARKMGVRSAVIAVATAMQESRLLNLASGDADSLGLFQQRPSAGWGTTQQLMDPAYAASAFLTALQRHQQADPAWATQPLWATAQAVQASGFPTAYARWESEAAGMVQQIATSLM